MDIQGTEQQLLQLVKKMGAYEEALNLIFWDLRTGAPKKGLNQRSEVIGLLTAELYEMSTGDEMKSYIDALSEEKVKAALPAITQKLVEECKKEYELNKKIPADEYKAFTMLATQAESAWEEAKEAADFSLFQPYLEQIVAYKRKFIDYWGYEGNKYNTLLDQYEQGMTVEVLDEVFGRLRDELVPLVKGINVSRNKPATEFLYRHFSKEKQKQFSIGILKQLQYDFDAGRLDETVHPFEITINNKDVRITTRYDEQDFRTAVFGTIHECGHAIYEQNIADELIGTGLATGTSMGIHESQSLFHEIFIGRNYHFWEKNYDALQKVAPEQFGDVSLEDFYRAINESKPSLIRIEADEVTYPLHIMIRYELEKALMNGELEVADLPQAWNDKYEEYLGIRPGNDGEGVLQDVHWAGGDFGYFPSYALGYIYAAQFMNAMKKELPEFEQLLSAGNIKPIKDWLAENIHRHGKMKEPLELLQDITGEGLNVQYLIDYLKEKYKEVYQLTV